MLYLSANEHQDVILDQAEDSMENSWHEPEPMDETDFPLETMHNEETLAPVLEASDSEPDSSDVEDEIERSWSSGSDPDLRRDDGQDLDEFYHEQSDEYNYEDQDEYAYEQRTELVHRQQETFSYQQQDAFIYQQRDDLVGHQQQEFVPSSGTSSSTINVRTTPMSNTITLFTNSQMTTYTSSQMNLLMRSPMHRLRLAAPRAAGDCHGSRNEQSLAPAKSDALSSASRREQKSVVDPGVYRANDTAECCFKIVIISSELRVRAINSCCLMGIRNDKKQHLWTKAYIMYIVSCDQLGPGAIGVHVLSTSHFPALV